MNITQTSIVLVPVPVGRVLKLVEFASKPDQRGLSSSSRLEFMMERTQPVQTSSISHGFRNDTDTYKSCIHR